MYAGLPKNLKTWKNLEFVKTLQNLEFLTTLNVK